MTVTLTPCGEGDEARTNLTAALEVAAERCREQGAGGVAIEDPFAVVNRTWVDDELPPDLIPHTGIAKVKAYFPSERAGAELTSGLAASLQGLERTGLAHVTVTTGTVQESDWAEAWKRYYHPIRVGNGLVVKPTWEPFARQAGDIVIELDPGMAFGTGTHPTTALCLEALEAWRDRYRERLVWDVGTGSGILAIAAAQLGARAVWAVDIDPVSVKTATDNVRLNGLSDRVRVWEGTVDRLVAEGERPTLVVANIVAGAILDIVPHVRNALPETGLFVASGIIDIRTQEVRERLISNRFQVLAECRSDSWVCLVAEVIP